MRRRREWKRGPKRNNNNCLAPASFSNSTTARSLVAEVKGDAEPRGYRLDGGFTAAVEIPRGTNYRSPDSTDSGHKAGLVASNEYRPPAVNLVGLGDRGFVPVIGLQGDEEASANEITDAVEGVFLE